MKYFHKITDEKTRQSLLACNGMMALGKLTLRNAYGNNETVHHVPGTEHIALSIESLTEEPEALVSLRKNLYDHDVYVALDRDQTSFIISDLTYFSKSRDEKIKHWQDMLATKLITFEIAISFNEEKVMLQIKIQSIEPADSDMLTKKYIRFPHVKQNQPFIEYALYNAHPFEFSNAILVNETPKYLICNDHLYYNFPEWEQSPENHNTWFIPEKSATIYRANLTSLLTDISHVKIETFSDLIFLNIENENDFKLKLIEFSEIVPDTKIKIPLTEPQLQDMLPQTSDIFATTGVKAEYLFLEELRYLTLSESLLYDPKDLMNFHISLKTNPLTVVAGMSGTGKTRLAKAYAKILGLAEEKGDLLFLPISPSYLEPSDVLGYLNPSSGYFVPSEAGLVDVLVRAHRNPEQMFMVIFDEMNLSQVEHWFAPFLSILEKPEHDRLLHLYSENAVCHNADLYPAHVNVGANVLFVGTINLDETTKELSDRLLDRVNLVTLKKSGFMQFSTLNLDRISYRGIAFNYHDFQHWKNHDRPTSAFRTDELKFFDELHRLISKYDAQKGVSFRFLNRLGRYILNIPLNEKGKPELHPLKAIDMSIKQGLLTKVKGSKQQIGNLIGELTDPEATLVDSELLSFIDNNPWISDKAFERTREEIKRKALELGLYGYTN